MKRLTGLTASQGIAIGKVFPLLDKERVAVPRYTIKPCDVPLEKERLQVALKATIDELQESINKTDAEQTEEGELLGTYLVMLQDTEFIKGIHTKLEDELVNVEAVLDTKLDEAAKMLASSDSAYIRERALDIKDAFAGVFEKLDAKQEKHNRFEGVPKGAIIVARDIMTSEVLSLKNANPAGIVMEEGGITAHISIIASSWGLPMIVSTKHCMEYALAGLDAVLDANAGLVIFNPSDEALLSYKAQITQNSTDFSSIISTLSSEEYGIKTLDGEKITISANIAFKEESSNPVMQIADGVGLFRTEFLFLQDNVIPDEQVQFKTYCDVASQLKGKPCIIRTFDAGADKMLKEQEGLHEKNPLLGWRAIRYCFARPLIFRTQIRALLRSSAFGNVHILIPMISTISEVRKVRVILEEEKQKLEREGLPFNKNTPLGIMVEVPSVAVSADIFAKYVDFMSIGTNDLVQYVMAADRENGKVSSLANYFEPAILHLIKASIDSSAYAKNADYFVSMCGNMASCKEAVFLLLGMGLHHFSVPCSKVAQMKMFASKIDVGKARESCEAVLKMEEPSQIESFIAEKVVQYTTKQE